MTTTDVDVAEELKETTEQATEKANAIVNYIQEHIPDIIAFSIKVVLCILVFLIGRLVIRLIGKLLARTLERAQVDVGVKQFACSFTKYGLYALLIFGIASSLGVDTVSVAALFASAGLGIGLALQGSLSNFAGGLLILLLKPFKVGDYIIEDSNHNEGTVKEIQLFYTKLHSVDNRTIVLPNGMLTNNSIINTSATNERQLDLRIHVGYQENIKDVKALLQEIVEAEPLIHKERPVNIFVDDLGDSSVVFGIRAWTDNSDYLPAKWRVLEEVKQRFDEKGITLAYPQLDVHISE